MAKFFWIPGPIKFEPEVETRYRNAQNAQFLPLVRGVIAFCLILQPVYILWDYVYADENFRHLLYVRTAETGILFCMLVLTLEKGIHRLVLPLATAVFISIVTTISIALSMVYDGFMLGLSGLLVPFVIIPLMPSFMWAVMNVFCAITLANLVMSYADVPIIMQVNANFYLWTFAALGILMSLLFVYRSRKLFQMEMHMERVATTDDLSGLSNRRHFMKQSEQVLRAHRYKRKLSMLMLDVDHFKNINDTYGHHVGDIAITEIGRVCKHELRKADFVARIGVDRGHSETGDKDNTDINVPLIGRLGGEEFAILLPETDKDGAYLAAERIRTLMEQNTIPLEDGQQLHFTISIGVATLRSGDDRDTIESLLKRADEALYGAKEGGRNRVVVAGEEPVAPQQPPATPAPAEAAPEMQEIVTDGEFQFIDRRKK